jgi:NAD-dependent dihydropyrimidine dehydrogenase PreA subunit
MIALLSNDRCTRCNACVSACPSNVFERVPGQAPRIARPADCQTCYMCELYCDADALFVASSCHELEHVTEAEAIATGSLGQYRRDSGWGEWAADPRYQNQHWYMAVVFQRARSGV